MALHEHALPLRGQPLERRKPVALMLDDVVENVKVLGSVLGRDKYSLLLANSGEQAIQ
ncbi:MAG: hypothetical protein H7318_02755 [Oligoflexus sp.]|nr:hypothetical protein [Oligoflexus sp.]